MIEISHINKAFHKGTVDEAVVFSDFSLTVQPGEFVSIVGSNGSGKTTLLNLICGSDTPDGGQILLDGEDVTKRPEHKRAALIGRVHQDTRFGTSGELTILENMALADNKGGRYGLLPGINRRRTDEYRALLEQCGMGLENRLGTPVGALSGGQRQALALVIAAMSELKLLILDEHTAALDPHTAETVMVLTDRIVREKKLTALMVTHNLRYAVEYGTRLLMMDKGRAVLDRSGAEKQATRVEDLLDLFNQISIECGN